MSIISLQASAEVDYIEHTITNLWQDLTEQEESKKEKIKRLAELYKRKIQLGLLDIQPHEIAGEILKEIEIRGLDISKVTVYRAVPADCKDEREEDARTTLGVYNDSQFHVKLPNIKYDLEKLRGQDNAKVDEAHTELSQAEKDLQAQLRLIRDQKEKVEEIGQERKLTFSSHQKNDSHSTPKPEARETDLSDELYQLSEDILAVREKVIEFPPNEEDARAWAQGIRNFRMMFKGHLDEKYSKSIPEWFRVQITNIQSGKHAAATKHATMLPGGIKRNLTREQVGDNAEFILDVAWKVLNSFDGLAGLIAWHSKYMEKAVAQRKIDLSPELSEKA
jgi:hypothetical protein